MIDILEEKREVKPRAQLRQMISKWANAAQVKMNFSRVSKYLYEIDISTNEKHELEQKIYQLNEENELL